MVEIKSVSSTEVSSAAQKRNGFHEKYLKICKSENLMPVVEVKAKERYSQVVDFHADRIRVYDWIAIFRSLYNDKTLKSLAIRLRKNSLKGLSSLREDFFPFLQTFSSSVMENADTLKKTKAIEAQPVIYSKFLFSELADSLRNFAMNTNMLETLVLEGIPLTGNYMTTFVTGLSHNHSIKTISFARSIIGDEGCEELCATLKNMMNIETLNVSDCNLGVRGAEAVAAVVNSHKVRRFSEAWSQSLRYQTVNAESFPGLRKLIMSKNQGIGDEGVKKLLEALGEDAWIKDIEMQNCALTNGGAQEIINCLNANKSILSFNVASNPDISENFQRHILTILGAGENSDCDSSDSNSSEPEKMTKAKLIEEVRNLQNKLVLETHRRILAEEFSQQLETIVSDTKKQLEIQGTFHVPDGFQLVSNEVIENLTSE